MFDRLHRFLGHFRAAKGDAALLLDRAVLIAKFILLFERVWRTLLWPFVLTGCFVFVSLLDLWSSVPAWAHNVALLAYGGALIGLAWPLTRLAWPGREEALARLERDSDIGHRPASSYDDTPAHNPSPASGAFWRLHRKRLAGLVANLKPKIPSPRLDRSDPLAVRAVVLMLLIIAAVAAGRDAWDRVGSGFTPTTQNGAQNYRLHAWITPPLYTGKPPIVLADGAPLEILQSDAPKSLSVPEGSVVLVRLNGEQASRPKITFKESGTDNPLSLEPTSHQGQSTEYKFTLSKSGRLAAIGWGATSAEWRIDVITDRPPSIHLLDKPGATPRNALRLAYGIEDDYGVSQAEARFVLAPGTVDGQEPAATDNNSLIKPPVVPLRLPSLNATSGEGRTFKDLTSHPWAGLAVEMSLVARDQGDNEGSSEAIEFILPQRKFTKPLARAIIEQRGKLVVSRNAALAVAQALNGLTLAPERFSIDISVYLALRSAYWRLSFRKDDEGLISVVDQLWDVAVRIEDGDLSEAERALQAAQDRLMKAIQTGAPEAEIKRLVEELRTALGRFLQALAQSAGEAGLSAKVDGSPNELLLGAGDLDQLLRRIEDLAKTGSRELAQRLLGELRDILERLQMGMSAQNIQRDKMMKAVEGLGEIIMEQQKLLDETFNLKRQQQNQNRQPDQRSGALGKGQGRKGEGRGGQGQKNDGSGGLARRQGELGAQLGELLEQLQALGAGAPNQLEGAGRAMGDAERALGEQALGRATRQQSTALDRLRQGTQSMAEQMMQMLGAQAGRSGQGARDPLGRPKPAQGPDLGTSVKVPDEIDIQRARQILDELRRRLSEPSRPLLELDYLERLIRNF